MINDRNKEDYLRGVAHFQMQILSWYTWSPFIRLTLGPYNYESIR